jgi:flagellar hook-associated protein 2
MSTGAITTLGLGSGLDLQDILDQLKKADTAQITLKENTKNTLQQKINAYNSVNAKLFAMKSETLSLSLESNFLKNKVSVSDESIASVSVNDGISESSFVLNVTRKAQYNSWQTVGVASKDSVIYATPETGLTDAGSPVTTESGTMQILYGAAGQQQAINVSLDSGMSLEEIAEAVNASTANMGEDGNRLVTASIENNNGQYYIRLSAASGGNSLDSQISVADFSYVKPDTTIGISRADSENPLVLSIAPGTTYQEMADLINASANNPGVTASVIDTGKAETPYQLTLTSDETGEDYRISIQNLPMTEVNGAEGDSLNSAFSINGVDYERQTDTAISDVIPGVTLTLKKIGETSVGVQKNTEAVKESILSLVEKFNTLYNEIKNGETVTDDENQEEADSTETPLSNSYAMSRMLNDLQNLMLTTSSTLTGYKSLANIGLDINRDGTLVMDETLLDQALASDPNAVASLFIGDADAGVTGLGDIINNGLTQLVGSDGLIPTEIDSVETQMERIDQDIKNATEIMDKRYENMTQSFIRLDTYIRQLNSESTYLQSMINALNDTGDK